MFCFGIQSTIWVYRITRHFVGSIKIEKSRLKLSPKRD